MLPSADKLYGDTDFFSSRALNLPTVPELLFELDYRKKEVFPQHFNCFEMHLSNFSPQPVWHIHSYTDWAHIPYTLYISINAHNGEDYVRRLWCRV